MVGVLYEVTAFKVRPENFNCPEHRETLFFCGPAGLTNSSKIQLGAGRRRRAPEGGRSNLLVARIRVNGEWELLIMQRKYWMIRESCLELFECFSLGRAIVCEVSGLALLQQLI